jgi:hypothetical protein
VTDYWCHLGTLQVCPIRLQDIEQLPRVTWYLYFGKAEDLSYDRLMKFNREIADDIFRLLKQTINAVRMQNGLDFLYDVDETGLN